MTFLVLIGFLLFGAWLVRRADETYARLPTCRYRDLDGLVRQADRYTVSYVLLGFSGLVLYPAGVLSTVGIFAYALYRKFR